ncbi:MAG: hypothetical protein E7602_02475 [Ruminococcaceae bacterium]|nr:hypothetical protein [Oscillospiraceae bacterium]
MLRLVENKKIMKEWNWEKNRELDPQKLALGSAKIAWWKCLICDFEWKTSVRNRTQQGYGCPECARLKRMESRKKTLIKTHKTITDPQLIKEWNYQKNHPDLPQMYTIGSNKSVWWQCSVCGYEWKSKVNNRAINGRGCPCCANKTIVKGINDLGTVNPALAKEWDYEKNELTPNDVTIGSGKKIWWKCPKGHSYQASVMHRGHGTNCPVCFTGRQTSFAEKAFFYYIKKVRPDAISRCKTVLDGKMELDIYIPSLNMGIEYDGAYWHDKKDAKMREKKKFLLCQSKNIRLLRIKEIEYSPGGHYMSNNTWFADPSGNNKTLDELIQRLIDEIDPITGPLFTRNPLNVYSSVRVDTKKDRFEIMQMFISEETNNLAKSNPELVDEWNYERNSGLTLEMFSPKSGKKVWWKCSKCGNEWETTIGHRTAGTGCKKCHLSLSSKTTKRILQYNEKEEFVKEWDSITKASTELNINASNISMCAKGRRKHAGGFIWKYKNDPKDK